jgi:putative endonuclease
MKCLVTGGAGFTRPHCPRARFFYTYVLESSKDKKLYIGWTDNLIERMKEHLKGGVFSTKNRLPLQLIYYEACLSKKEAIMREKYFKTGFGRRFLKNRLAGSRGGRVGFNN